MDKGLLAVAILWATLTGLAILVPSLPQIQEWQALPNYNKYGPFHQQLAAGIFISCLVLVIAALWHDHAGGRKYEYQRR